MFVAVFAATVYLFVTIPKGFLPSRTPGSCWRSPKAAQDISFESMAEKQRLAANIIRADPNVDGGHGFHAGHRRPAPARRSISGACSCA